MTLYLDATNRIKIHDLLGINLTRQDTMCLDAVTASPVWWIGLMSQRLKRDKAQFECWVLEHHAALYRHALWMTSRGDVADDCVQETYYRAWNARKSLKDKAKVFSWLLTILRRTVYREYEQRSQNLKFTVEISEELVEQVEYKDQGEILDLIKAMSSISTAHRDILLLQTLHGFSYQEISDSLEIPMGTVMSRLSRAREALDDALNHNAFESKQRNVFRLKRGPSNNE